MRRTTFGIVASLAAAAGCITARATPTADPAAVGLTWVAHLNSPRNTGSRMNGDVRITPSVTKPNASHIVVNVTGGAQSARYPWVIASGSCVDLIPVDLGNRPMYPQIEVRSDGSGKITVDLPVVVPIDQRYHVVLFYTVNSSADDVAALCGDLAIANSK